MSSRGGKARRKTHGDAWPGTTWVEVFGTYAVLLWSLPDGAGEPGLLTMLRPLLDDGANEKLSGVIAAGFARDPAQLRRFRRGLDAGEVVLLQAELQVKSKTHPAAVYLHAKDASPEVRLGVDPAAAVTGVMWNEFSSGNNALED